MLLSFGFTQQDSTKKTFINQIGPIINDLPLLDSQIVKTIIDHHEPEQTWTSIVTTLPFQKTLGIKSDCIVENHDYVQTGISIVDAKKITNLDPVEEKFLVIDDKRIGLNLNTKDDYNLLGSL